MKLLLDENLEAAILRGLLRLSPDLDVVRVVDVGLAGAPDQAVLAWAAEQGRVVVSRDRATMSLEAARRIEAGEPMPGLLLIRRGASVGEVLRALELILACAQEGELEGVIEYIPF
jgi:predicted nuclease of predicted toxin-antitoxin system